LTSERNVSPSTHVHALCALIFLYRDVLLVEPPSIDGLARPPRTPRIPLVLTRDEVQRVLDSMKGVTRLMAELLYGSGLRLLECARIRVKDVDFSAGHLLVRDTKGQRDRLTLLPLRIRGSLQEHLRGVEAQHRGDLAGGAGHVELPGALAVKYPNASREWLWQWVFRRRAPIFTRRRGSGVGTICMKRYFSDHFATRFGSQASPSPPRATHSATASPPISWRPGTTSAQSRSYSVTATSPRRWSTRTFSIADLSASVVHSTEPLCFPYLLIRIWISSRPQALVEWEKLVRSGLHEVA
jgi:integrase